MGVCVLVCMCVCLSVVWHPWYFYLNINWNDCSWSALQWLLLSCRPFPEHLFTPLANCFCFPVSQFAIQGHGRDFIYFLQQQKQEQLLGKNFPCVNWIVIELRRALNNPQWLHASRNRIIWECFYYWICVSCELQLKLKRFSWLT